MGKASNRSTDCGNALPSVPSTFATEPPRAVRFERHGGTVFNWIADINTRKQERWRWAFYVSRGYLAAVTGSTYFVCWCKIVCNYDFRKAKMPVDSKSPILVVDDSGAVRSIVRKLLTQLGYIDVDEASDGAAALTKMNEKASYSLVISDWNMEPMNGKALLDHTRGKKEFEKLPFIMMTTNSEQYKILEAKYAGISFISKPFSAEALQSKILKIM